MIEDFVTNHILLIYIAVVLFPAPPGVGTNMNTHFAFHGLAVRISI